MMKINFDKMNFLYKAVMIVLTIILNLWVYIIGENIKISITLINFSILFIVGIFIYEAMYKKYMENIFTDLSDMLGAIIDMRDNEVFEVAEDTLLGKLQYQTIKLTNILKNKNAQMKLEKDEIKSLISDISHQLKTPLTNLKMYGEFLQDETLSIDERKQFNEVMMVSLNRLSFLVESMIKMSRLESGVIQLKKEKQNLNETILTSIANIQKKAKIKNINIQFNEVHRVNIVHDRNWVGEAIFNILENAVKYTNENGEIKVTLESYDIFTRIDIKDNGIGIEEDEIANIFKRFYRGRNSIDEEGIGIGLYLTRDIVTKQGGYIKVKSSNNGSRFSVFLPN